MAVSCLVYLPASACLPAAHQVIAWPLVLGEWLSENHAKKTTGLRTRQRGTQKRRKWRLRELREKRRTQPLLMEYWQEKRANSRKVGNPLSLSGSLWYRLGAVLFLSFLGCFGPTARQAGSRLLGHRSSTGWLQQDQRWQLYRRPATWAVVSVASVIN